MQTIFGRRRYVPELRDRNFNIRAFGERVAANSPIQGSAADLIKVAMIRIHAALRDRRLESKMLLQVHDELVFELPESEVERATLVITKVMADAPHPALNLSIPLKVDARAAQNWDEAH